MSETVKLLLGPVLALIPLFVWELVVKPMRTRRNIAHMLLAELHINLTELCYMHADMSVAPNRLPANLNLSRLAFDSIKVNLGELPC